ncbi:hypothetical protein R84B8_02414 [Treponema sp. R8-4-B8]
MRIPWLFLLLPELEIGFGRLVKIFKRSGQELPLRLYSCNIVVMVKAIHILICLHVILAITACNNDIESNNPSKDWKTYLKINNDTEYAVNVYIDIPPLFDMAPENKWRIEKNSSAQKELQPTAQGENGTTLYFEYLIPIGSSTIPYYPFNVDFVKLIKLEKGNVNTLSVPSLEGLQLDFIFPDSIFILIKNYSDNVIWLQRGIVTVNPYDASMRDIFPGTDALFIFDGNLVTLNNFTIGNTARWNFPSITLEKGYVYEFIINEETLPKIIPDIVWRIKPKITNTWKKEINTYNDGNFNDTVLNTHLMSIIRRLDISNWRSNYPKNKILTYNNSLISGEWGFGVIPVIIQNTGVAAPYEIPLIIAKDNEWTSSFIPNTNFYVGTSNLAYQTTFNDMINLGNNFVILTTYSNEKRSGICLFFINGQGQLIVKMDIVPENNLLGYTGTNLVKLDGNNFLVLGNKKQYTSANDEHFTASKAIIYKCQMGNNTVWSTEYSYPLHYANLSICGIETENSYIICGTASDNSSTKTIILKINKNDGNIDDVQTMGTANESWRPFSVCSDKTGNVYISGNATEGASSKAYILKLNSSFEQIWLKKYGNNYDNFLFDMNIKDNLLTAVGSSNDGSVIDPLFYGWQAGKGWVLRIDTDTGIIVNEIFDNAVTGYNSIVRLNDGGFVYSAIKSIDNTKPYWFNTFAIKVNEHLGFGK